jgi:hypothetical protein
MMEREDIRVAKNAFKDPKAISQSTVSVIKNKSFRNMPVKAPGSNFSRCT